MSTNIDLKVGLNMQIGSVPVSLNAEVATQTDPEQTVYTFGGCMQSASVNIGDFISYVGQQFGVTVALPPELQLEAMIDYVAAQVVYTSPKTGNATTELGVSAKFELIYINGGTTDTFTFTFYADTILASGGAANTYVVGGSIDMELDFSKIPLIGSIPGIDQYILNQVGFSYTNADPKTTGKQATFNIPTVSTSPNPLYTRTSPDGKDANNYSINPQTGPPDYKLDEGGFSLTVGLIKKDTGAVENNLALPLSLPTAAPTVGPATYYQTSGAAVQTSPPAGPVHWISVNKTFGPVNLQKIGLNYSGGEATFGISAGMSMGGFTLDVQGMTITFPLPLPGMPAGKGVSFDIQGLGMDFQKGGLTIGGAFMKSVDNGFTNYFGEVIVQVGSFGFKAIGGYAPAQNGQPAAFFIYANLDVPLGGPPFLYVTGLAFGFGVNYGLVLPTIDTLPTYPLLPDQAPPQGSAQDALTSVIQHLENGTVIINEPGENWVGAGIQFTSFDMVSAFAMITVSFGVEMQVALIGSCSIILPKGDPEPLAEIDIDLVASFTPSTGLMAVLGVIAPTSYVYGPFVKLSGGFAFYTWFSGDHKGDFVVTIGGYHPAYTKPTWYPAVPRMQMSFNLGPFQAGGQAYLALTPGMFMAGVQFMATFTAGPVKAWFGLGADFLVCWSPFSYQADAYVNIGCSVDLGLFTLSAHIGADLQIWGPSFGGNADVDLDVVSFSISFGSSASQPAPVSWQNLEQNFLPKPVDSSAIHAVRPMKLMATALAADAPAPASVTANVTATVAVGLVGKDTTSQDGEKWDWVVDPDNFMIVTATTVPANQLNWMTGAGSPATISNVVADYDLPDVDVTLHPYLELAAGTKTFSPTQVWNTEMGVKPMSLTDVVSVHTVTLCKRTATGGKTFTDYIKEVTIEPVLGSSNTALWGNTTVGTDPNIPPLLDSTLLGIQIIPLPRDPDTVSNVPLIDLLFTSGNQTGFTYTSASPDPSYATSVSLDPVSFALTIGVSGQATESLVNDEYILSALVDSWVCSQRDTILADLSANGFGTASQVKLNIMGGTESLTDWPVVNILGKVNAA